jgi:Flp pilus assembly protein TadB
MKYLFIFCNVALLYAVYALLGYFHLIMILFITLQVCTLMYLLLWMKKRQMRRHARLYLEDLCKAA